MARAKWVSQTRARTHGSAQKKKDLTGCLSISDQQPQQVNEPQIALGLLWAIGTVLPTHLPTSGRVGESDLKLVDVNSHVFSSQRTWGCDIIPLQERYTAQDMQVAGTCLLSIDCCRLYHLQHFHPMIEASCGHTCYVRSRALESLFPKKGSWPTRQHVQSLLVGTVFAWVGAVVSFWSGVNGYSDIFFSSDPAR